MSDLVFECAGPAGETLRIAWNREVLSVLGHATEQRRPAWSIGGEPDWEELSALRILSARLDDERLIAIVALRPVGTGGHGDEVLVGAVGNAEGFDQVEQALLSTEYDPQGVPRRVGLELYPEHGSLPLRIAGETTATALSDSGGVRRVSADLTMRSGGVGGVGVLDTLRRI